MFKKTTNTSIVLVMVIRAKSSTEVRAEQCRNGKRMKAERALAMRDHTITVYHEHSGRKCVTGGKEICEGGVTDKK